MRGSGVGKVVASKSAKYPVGTYVSSFSGWTEFAVLNDSSMEVRKVEVPEGVRLTDALGVLGLSALSLLSDHPAIQCLSCVFLRIPYNQLGNGGIIEPD